MPSPSSQTYDLSDSCTEAPTTVAARMITANYCKGVDRDGAACVGDERFLRCPSAAILAELRGFMYRWPNGPGSQLTGRH